MFAENFGWVRFLVVCSYIKSIPKTHENLFSVGKGGPIATFNLFFSWVRLGLGLVSSSVSCQCFKVFQPNTILVHRKHRSISFVFVSRSGAAYSRRGKRGKCAGLFHARIASAIKCRWIDRLTRLGGDTRKSTSGVIQ